MSDISGHPPGMAIKTGESAGIGLFPYRITTDYGNQMMTVVVNGEWTGSLDNPSSIILTIVYDPDTQQSSISFCFKMAVPGTSVNATLSDGTQDYPIILSVPM